MKILAIRGKNLASLDGEFEIDFTTEPLKSAGIFAITGQTGAGKSTILDALCLALFDDAPRLNKAESIKKEDLESLNDKISPQDCRNILRRGASDGYAEVDFIALNGDTYRSRWIVRRARGKFDGSLQATSIILENLSTGVQEQGTKKELLVRITEIIGLTFEQFTRAVLLAQGDFANFLKAKQHEKAELLEKLTGTDIYSKISVLVYQKAIEAKNSLNLVLQRIQDVKLLSEDELAWICQEKENLEKETGPLLFQKAFIEKKLYWQQQEEQLLNEIAKAEAEVKSLKEKVTLATSRYEYMSLLDTAQEIRDSYLSLTNKQNQFENLILNLQHKEENLKDVSEKINKIDIDLKNEKITLDDIEQKYVFLKPEIARAKELDFKIISVEDKLNEVDKELGILRKQEKASEQTISSLKQHEIKLKQKQNEILAWFIEYDNYKSLVPKIDYIVSLISNSYSVKQQQTVASRSIESSKAILNTYNNQFIQYEKEAEMLNNLLPTEILNLRNKLEEGKPCPVCGSIHHPLQKQTDQSDRIDEKRLEAQKGKLAVTIAETKAYIEETKKNITEFEIHTINYQTQYNHIYNEIKELLSIVPQWEVELTKETLKEKLIQFVSQWNDNKKDVDAANQQLQNLAVKMEAEVKALDSIKNKITEKEDLRKEIEKILTEHSSQRKLLIENKSVEDIERYYSDMQKRSSEKYEETRFKKNEIEKEKAIIEGTINQLQKDKELEERQIIKLNSEVQEWLKDRKHQISSDLLNDLMSKSREWINQEKMYLNELRNHELVAKTTLEERISKLSKHLESENKLSDGETKELLSQQLIQISERIEVINKRLTEINVLLLTHQNGKKQIKAFEKELNQKTELSNNWEKLNDLLGSASGNKFKTIAQGYTLDVLLSYANVHLQELTSRYRLEKIPGTLALQVIDNDMLGEVRTVHSLSGGESFLISLALALGLSSLSSNKMKIESLFIDEGFGALDLDTLTVAVDALDNLHTQGRKIGVISHIEEMKERITTQIQVIRSTNGKSMIQIVG